MSYFSNNQFYNYFIYSILILVIFPNIYNDEVTDSIGKYPEFIKKLKNHEFKKLVFLVGAGISTSAGIPDFRSDNGVFHQIKEKYNLNSPQQFFHIDYFYKNPNLFYEFSKNFFSKSYKY